MKPSTKPRDASATRASILWAAQVAFSHQGYTAVGIREIAARAGVNSSLITRYFRSKSGLFEAALTEAIRAERLFSVERHRLGEYLLGQFLRTDLDITPPAMIALSAGDADASAVAASAAQQEVIRPLG